MKWLCATFVLLLGQLTAQAQHRIDVYAVQGPPRASHTFAVVDGRHVISWLPANGKVRPLRLRQQPGVNATWEETLAWAKGRPVYFVGSAPLDEAGYRRALYQIDRLNSGLAGYKAFGRHNCVHAVGDVTGLRGANFAWGVRASRRALDSVR